MNRSGLGGLVDRAFDALARVYARVLAHGLKHPVAVLVAATVLLGVAFLVFRALPSEFVPSQDQGRLMLRVQTAVGSDIRETDMAFRKVESLRHGPPRGDALLRRRRRHAAAA